MTRNLMRRLEKLEQAKPAVVRRWHWIIEETQQELEAQAAALRTSPEWRDGDGLLCRLIADPPHWVAA